VAATATGWRLAPELVDASNIFRIGWRLAYCFYVA